MVSKDQAIGGAILLVCVVVAVVYLVALFGYQQLIQPWLNIGSVDAVRFWLIAVPVFVAFVAILFHWRMDRLDNGNNPASKTNRRNHN